MTNPTNKGKGRAYAFLRDNVNHNGDDCLIWPFNTLPTGYGTFSYLGTLYYAHRFMCELVKGPASSSEHEAAHSCGRGKSGCVDPRHLSWKTTKENAADGVRQGTYARKRNGPQSRLTAQQIAEIWAARGRERPGETAARFGI